MSEGGFRIMEALSGVDESLLERSDKAGRTKKTKTAYRWMLRYGSLCAACLCLCVLGAAFWKSQMASKGVDMAKGDSSMKIDAGEERTEFAIVQEAAEEEMAEEMAEDKADGTAVTSGGEYAATKEIGMKQMVTVLEQYWPALLPKEYTDEMEYLVIDEQEDGNPEKIICSWNHKNQFFQVTVMPVTDNGEENQINNEPELKKDKEIPVFDLESEWTELIPEANEEGIVSFGLMYQRDILVMYEGTLDKATICMLLEAMEDNL